MNNESVAHKWVYNDGRNGEAEGSNFSYRYDKLYSFYSVLAIINRVEKIVLVDENIAGYSNTSRKHANHMRRAIPSYYKIIEYPFNMEPFEYYYNQIIQCIRLQKRARVTDYSHQIKKYISQANILAEYKKLKSNKFLKIVNKIDVNTIIESSEDLIKKHQESLDKKKRLEDKKRQEERQKKLDAFLNQKYDPKNKQTIKYNPKQVGVYIKYNEEKNSILTSNSIEVPALQSLIMYKMYLKDPKSIIGKKLEHFTVIEAKKDYVKIGCTTISAKELDRVLSKLIKDKWWKKNMKI